MSWDILGGGASSPMTNARNLKRPQCGALAKDSANCCLIPSAEFCEWTPDRHDLGDGQTPPKGEMWFAVPGQPTFAVAGFWQHTKAGAGLAMVTCDPNQLVAPVHPKAMITILAERDWDQWLQGSYADAVALQRPYPAADMTVRGPVFPTRSVIPAAAAATT